MKRISALLVTVALIIPAFAQKPVLNERMLQGQPKPIVSTAAPAHKPMILNTGKPLTAQEKSQFLASVVKTIRTTTLSGKAPAKPMSQAATPTPTVTLITPSTMSGNSAVDVSLWHADEVDLGQNLYCLAAGPSSYLSFLVTVQPNTVYMLAINGTPIAGYTQFTITAGNQNPQTFNVNNQALVKNEFAYAFDSTSTGKIEVKIWGTNGWTFWNAELTATSLQ